jgi:hypothetical protein
LKCRRYFHKEPKKWKKHILAFFAVQRSNVVEAEPKDQSSQNRRKKDPKDKSTKKKKKEKKKTDSNIEKQNFSPKTEII